jgi:hypothetical protein
MIQPKLDFQTVPIFDTKNLYLMDMSNWEYLIDKTAFYAIKMPGSKNYTKIVAHKNSLQKIDSVWLGLSNIQDECKVDLPDGIYWVALEICDGVDFREEKMFIKYDRLTKMIDEVVLSEAYICEENEYRRKQLRDVWEYREAMLSFARCGNWEDAMYLYDKIKNLINDLNK